LSVVGDTLLLYGGYMKEVIKGKKARGIIHTDLWAIKLSFELNTLKWERRKRSGASPTARSGMGVVSHKGRLFFFGGVMDVKEDDETIESICLDDMCQYNPEQGKFYNVQFRGKSPSELAIRPFVRFFFNISLNTNTLSFSHVLMQ
jgi:hypothetical protein